MGNDKLHVLIIPSWYPTPSNPVSGLFFREQALSLSKNGIKTGIINVHMDSIKKANINPKGFFFTRDEGICQYSFYGVSIPFLTEVNTFLIKCIARMLFARYVRRCGMPDILHAHSVFRAGLIAGDLSERYGLPYIITEHYSGYTRNVFSNRIKKQMEKCILRCSFCIAVSESFRGYLSSYFSMGKKKWLYVPNMVDSIFFDHPILDVKKDTYSFLCIASLTENKAVDMLIRSFSHAFPHEDRVKLLIAGEGPEKAKLMKLVADKKLSSRVEFLGRLSRKQVVEAFRSADALVVSSKYETFGVVIAESLAMGVPVVSTRCGGPESIVTQGDGLLVDCGDESKFAEALEQVYHNRADYRPVEIRSRCAARFSEDVVVEKIKDIYRSVLHSHN